ncbi:TIR domain-containing protein [Acaryochloris marina]|uniref:TIR domain-containing protein n=1 Tax=Acaryochloris marina TaxID=155978 RepID=UPI001BAF048A|nr:TIR domain-containing protein [Acaryochloris marina]QUY43493.1 nucleotide-binding protein [Acaryochloris marina S15]
MMKIFVGSSSEAGLVDTEVRKILEDQDTLPIDWRTQFRAGEFGLESLIRIKGECDAAILITTPDDKIWYRGAEGFSPRDNLLFELGLFISALGRERVGLVVATNQNGDVPKIPTDLAGLNYVYYKAGKNAGNTEAITKWVLHLRKLVGSGVKSFENPFDVLESQFSRLPQDWKDDVENYIIEPFRDQSYSALRGEFTLDISQYYNSLFTALSSIAGTDIRIKAVSLLSHEIWDSDPFQLQYQDYNLQAGKEGVPIQRIFVINDGVEPSLWATIQKQLENNIQVKVVDARLFSKFANLDDIVLLQGTAYSRCYKSQQFFNATNRLKSANLNLNTNYCNDLSLSFDALWKLAKQPTPNIVRMQQKSIAPPGDTFEIYDLDHDVITCEQAAEAKAIPLQNELKTIVTKTSNGIIALHLRGDRQIYWRAVKNILDVKEAEMLSKEDLAKLHLSDGTVSAILDPVWSMAHLISREVIQLDFVSTNNSTRRQYFRFDPLVLLSTAKHMIGSFEKQV